MSWLFSRALVEEYLPAECFESGRSAQLRLVDTRHKFLHNGKTMDALSHSRYGLTLELLTPKSGAELLTLYLEDFRARTSVQQDLGPGSREKGLACGRKWQESSMSQGHLLPLSKTATCSEQEVLMSSCETLPTWGSMQNGELFQLHSSEHLIKEKGCGYSLPTPSGVRSGKNHVAGRLDEWGGSSNPFRGTELGPIKNPAFEEWLMGWPVQWTELTQSAMDKFRLWQQEHCLTS